MGNIYLARDSLLDRLVAVKFIAAARPGTEARDRFRVEARAIARLSHPNVVAVYRSGEVDGRPYLVTEFVRGRSLAEVPRPMSPGEVQHIALGLARGLAAAHRQRVLHRDIKPANVMLTDEGEVKLVDFGLAKLLQSSAGASESPEEGMRLGGLPPPDETPSHAMLGTPHYMAPEVLQGRPASPRSDLFSVGAVLYELCTGAPVRAQPGAFVTEAWMLEMGAPLGTLPGWRGSRFAAIVDRCLKVSLEDRFSSAEGLCDALAGLATEHAESGIPEGNPYRGLQPFEAEHSALFFGRSAEVAAVVERLRTEPLMVVTGDSGVGKSSLCRAGVLPRVRGGAAPEERSIRVAALVPGREPVRALALALATVLERDESLLVKLIREEPGALGVEARRWKARESALVVFVDQLEELFTLAPPEEAALFAEAVASLGAVAANLRVLMAIRGDFFTRLAALPGLGADVSRALYLLGPLSGEAMREAIVGPAQRQGVGFESEQLIGDLMEPAARAAGGLPLLQFTMAELWDARDVQRQVIPARALQAMGGVGGALARHADGVLASLSVDEVDAARLLLLRMVTPGGLTVRRGVEELEPAHPRMRVALEALIRARLVVAREREGRTYYELAHEALVEGWGTLRRWMDADAGQRELRERIEVSASEWDRLGRASEGLWSARQLTEVARVNLAALSECGARFLTASRVSMRRRRNQRLATIVFVPLLGGAALAGVWLQARDTIEKQVVAAMRDAREDTERGQRHLAEALRLRGEAFGRFDQVRGSPEVISRRSQEAEALWSKAEDAATAAELALLGAVQHHEVAYRLDPARRDIQAALGDVLVQRIQLAEAFNHEERHDELLRQLPAFDPDGSRVQWAQAAPKLELQTTPPGAEVLLERYEWERGQPTRATSLGSLGHTPLKDVVLARGPGSYRLTLKLPGHTTVRYPLVLSRAESTSLGITLLKEGAVPAGFVYVPEGRFLMGSAHPDPFRRGLLNTQPLREVRTGAYLISRMEVTFADWLAFIDALPGELRGERTPSLVERDWTGLELEQRKDGRRVLKMLLDAQTITAAEGEPFRNPNRSRRAAQDWRRFPVTAISRLDAEAYLAWLDRTGRVPGARLCDEWEWERAARGADGRSFPHGDYLRPDDANYDETYGRVPGAFGPDEVGSHPASESPFGVHDLTGNVYEWVRSKRGDEEAVIRGGMWYYDSVSNLIVNRTLAVPTTKNMGLGLRVCAEVPR
ncbi:Serine/threonine-protein kinase PknD [Myxococcus stipitatus]